MKLGFVSSDSAQSMVTSRTAGEAINAGKVVCVKPSDGKIYNLVDGIKDNHFILGIAGRKYLTKVGENAEQWAAGEVAQVVKFGTVTMKKVSSETIGSKVYYKTATGELSSTASGNIQLVGVSVNDTHGDTTLIEVNIGLGITYG